MRGGREGGKGGKGKEGGRYWNVREDYILTSLLGNHSCQL